jgi:drug/metabolite transporter (DMT)-like permease
MPNLNEQKDNIVIGCACTVLATLMFGIMAAAGKVLTVDHHPAQIVFYRYGIPLIPILIFMLSKKGVHLFKTTKPRTMLLRAFCGVAAMGMHVAALMYLPIADEKVISFASSLFAPIIAYFILKEHVGLKRWTAILIGFGGVILIAGPTGNLNLIGVGFALIAALMDAGMITTLRYLKTENALTITFYLCVFGVITTGIFFMPFVATPFTTVKEITLITLVSVAGLFAQLAMTYASRFAPSAVVAPFMYSALIWAIIFDITIWSNMPTWTMLGGAAIIISANLFILYREQKHAKQQSE